MHQLAASTAAFFMLPLRFVRPAFCVLLAIASPLSAHDFWIEPSSFRPALDESVQVRLFVGESFRGAPVPRLPERIERFAAIAASGETPIPGEAGVDPAGFARFASPGAHWIVYDSASTPIELPATKFEIYLAEEGLEAVSNARSAAGASTAPGREIYSRCAKSLVGVGDNDVEAMAALVQRPVGLELELVPESDPRRLGYDGPLAIQLLFRGAPLANALVVALPRSRPDARTTARTDVSGRVWLTLTSREIWLVKAVHMTTVPPGRSDADWESFWASLTFEIP